MRAVGYLPLNNACSVHLNHFALCSAHSEIAVRPSVTRVAYDYVSGESPALHLRSAAKAI